MIVVGRTGTGDEQADEREADADFLAHMAGYGVGQAQLEAVQAQVAAVAAAMVQRSQARTAALESTRARDRAFRALDSWMSGFMTMSRIALADLPAQPRYDQRSLVKPKPA